MGEDNQRPASERVEAKGGESRSEGEVSPSLPNRAPVEALAQARRSSLRLFVRYPRNAPASVRFANFVGATAGRLAFVPRPFPARPPLTPPAEGGRRPSPKREGAFDFAECPFSPAGGIRMRTTAAQIAVGGLRRPSRLAATDASVTLAPPLPYSPARRASQLPRLSAASLAAPSPRPAMMSARRRRYSPRLMFSPPRLSRWSE